MLISLNDLTFKSKPMLLSQLLHLINIDSNFSTLHYVYIKINASETLQKYFIIKVLVIYMFQWYPQYAPKWNEKETTELFLLCWLDITFWYHYDQFIFIWRSIHVRINVFLYTGASRLSFHSCTNAGWLI